MCGGDWVRGWGGRRLAAGCIFTKNRAFIGEFLVSPGEYVDWCSWCGEVVTFVGI